MLKRGVKMRFGLARHSERARGPEHKHETVGCRILSTIERNDEVSVDKGREVDRGVDTQNMAGNGKGCRRLVRW